MHTRLSQLLSSLDTIDPSYGPTADVPEHVLTHAYRTRNSLVLVALSVAIAAGMPGGVAPDPADPALMLVYVELPTGQVSWHLPAYTGPWDGHSREEKRQRIRQFCGQYPT